MSEIDLEFQYDSIIHDIIYDCFSVYVDNPNIDLIQHDFLESLKEHRIELCLDMLATALHHLYTACCLENDVMYLEDRDEAYKCVIERNKEIAKAYKVLTGNCLENDDEW